MNQLIQSFGEKNVGELNLSMFSLLSGSGVWLGKILVNDVRFTNSPPSCHRFAL